MASADVPDIGVRLSAEGEAQFVALLRRVRSEMELTAKKSGQSFGGFNSILGRTRSALAGLGIAASVTSLVAFARAGADSADALEDNAAAAGTSVQRFSALAALFQLNGGNAEFLRDSLGRLANKIQDLRGGNEAVARSFRALGLSVKDFEGKDTAQALDVVARAVVAIEDPIERGAAAIDLLGRSGARAIPALQALARKGLGGVEDGARNMGLLLDNETVAAAARVSDELVVMQQQATALAINLSAGLGPAVHDTFSVMSAELAGAQSDWKTAGTVIGNVLKGLFLLLALVLDGIIVLFYNTVEVIQGVSRVITLALSGQFQHIPALWQGVLDEIGKRTEAFASRNANRFAALTGSLQGVSSGSSSTAPAPKPARGAAGGAEDKAEFSRRLAARRAFLDAERRLLDLNLKARADRERFRFEEGLTDLETYYARRRQILEAGLEGELQALEARRAAEAQNPDRAAAQAAVAGIDAEIALRRRQGEVEQVALAREQLAERRKLQAEVLSFEEQLAEAQGRRHEAEIAAIDREVAAFQSALAREGALTESAQERRVNEFRNALQASAAFDRQLGAFRSELDGIAAARAAIEQRVASAQISELEGARQILALEQSRIPALERIAALALEAARGTGDPARVRQAEELATAVQALGISATEADRRLANLKQELAGVFESSLVQSLSASGDAFENFGQRALSVLSSIAAGVQRLAAELLSNAFVRLVLGLASTGASVKIAPNPGVGDVGTMAGGGLLVGPGTGTSDSIPLWGSTGEFMIRQRVVSKPGGLALLEALNSEALDPLDLRPVQVRMPPMRPQRLASGGLVGRGSPGAPGADGRLTVGLEDGLIARGLSTRQGSRAVVEVISANRDAVGRALGLRRT